MGPGLELALKSPSRRLFSTSLPHGATTLRAALTKHILCDSIQTCSLLSHCLLLSEQPLRGQRSIEPSSGRRNQTQVCALSVRERTLPAPCRLPLFHAYSFGDSVTANMGHKLSRCVHFLQDEIKLTVRIPSRSQACAASAPSASARMAALQPGERHQSSLPLSIE